MKFFPSLCNCYYQSRDTKGDRRHVAVILTSMSIRPPPRRQRPSGTRHHRARRTSVTSSRASRNGRFLADHQFSPTSPSPSVPSFSCEISKIKDRQQYSGQLGLLLNETVERMRVFSFYSVLPLLSTHSSPVFGEFTHEFLTILKAQGNERLRRELCAVIRQRDNKHQRKRRKSCRQPNKNSSYFAWTSTERLHLRTLYLRILSTFSKL